VPLTFNYDTLLEYALDPSDSNLTVWKTTQIALALSRIQLHGSVNWGQIVENEIPANMNLGHSPSILSYLIEHAAELRISNKFALCNQLTMGVAEAYPYSPQLPFPSKEKISSRALTSL